MIGSGTERWHNILRTGLDYNETVCGRVSVPYSELNGTLMSRRMSNDRLGTGEADYQIRSRSILRSRIYDLHAVIREGKYVREGQSGL
jgi:hypothetical protein